MSFLCGCQLGSWLKVFSGTPLVATRLRGFEKGDKATYFWVFWKKPQCATGWHNGAIFVAMKMRTITAGSAAWGGGGDLLETTWGMGSQNQCSGSGTTESTVSQMTSICFLIKPVTWLKKNLQGQSDICMMWESRIWKKNGKASYWALPGYLANLFSPHSLML